MFQLPALSPATSKIGTPRVKDEQDADLAAPARSGPEFGQVRDLGVGDGVDEWPPSAGPERLGV